MRVKTQEEQDYIIKGGKILGEILEEISLMAKPGVSTFDIDKKAEELIIKAGGRPAFKNYNPGGHRPFPGTICASLNTEVVHGIPKKKKILQDGDIFGIDIGMQWPVDCGKGENGNGFYTDTAVTLPIGEVNEEVKQLLSVTKKALELSLKQVKPGNTIADVGRVVEDYVEPQGYGIVEDLVGHGVGHSVHEDPAVPNYYDERNEDLIIPEGAVLALEPMITMGSHEVMTAADGWGIVSVDGKLNAHFEHTVIATKTGPVVVTRRPNEKY